MESHAEMFIGKSIMETGKASLLGKGENPRNFVAVNDVAQIVFTVLTEPARQGGIIAVGGPENRTNMEVVRLYEQQLGRPVKVSHLPVAALQLIYRVLRPFNAGLSQIMQAGIVIDTTDQTFDPGEMLQTFPLELTTLEEFIASRTGEYQTAV